MRSTICRTAAHDDAMIDQPASGARVSAK